MRGLQEGAGRGDLAPTGDARWARMAGSGRAWSQTGRAQPAKGGSSTCCAPTGDGARGPRRWQMGCQTGSLTRRDGRWAVRESNDCLRMRSRFGYVRSFAALRMTGVGRLRVVHECLKRSHRRMKAPVAALKGGPSWVHDEPSRQMTLAGGQDDMLGECEIASSLRSSQRR